MSPFQVFCLIKSSVKLDRVATIEPCVFCKIIYISVTFSRFLMSSTIYFQVANSKYSFKQFLLSFPSTIRVSQLIQSTKQALLYVSHVCWFHNLENFLLLLPKLKHLHIQCQKTFQPSACTKKYYRPYNSAKSFCRIYFSSFFFFGLTVALFVAHMLGKACTTFIV